MAKGDRVIAVSDFIAGLIRTRYGTAEEKLRVIHGGVNLGKFDPAILVPEMLYRVARSWVVDLVEPVILLPGRLTSWKGQKILIQALARMKHRDAVAILSAARRAASPMSMNWFPWRRGSASRTGCGWSAIPRISRRR